MHAGDYKTLITVFLKSLEKEQFTMISLTTTCGALITFMQLGIICI